MSWDKSSIFASYYWSLSVCVMYGLCMCQYFMARMSSFTFFIWGADDLFISVFRNSQILCSASANISGDIPESAGGLSQYEKVIETLTTLFPVWVRLRLFFFNLASFQFLTCSLVESWLTLTYMGRSSWGLLSVFTSQLL